MVDSKSLENFSAEERQNFVKDIVGIYKNHGLESQIESPKLYD